SARQARPKYVRLKPDEHQIHEYPNATVDPNASLIPIQTARKKPRRQDRFRSLAARLIQFNDSFDAFGEIPNVRLAATLTTATPPAPPPHRRNHRVRRRRHHDLHAGELR